MIELLLDIHRRLRGYRFQFWVATLFRATGDVLFLFPAYAFANVVTILSRQPGGESWPSIRWYLLGWVLAVVGRNVCHFLGKRIGFMVAERLSMHTTLDAIHHLFQLDMSWHEIENSGNKLKRIQNASDGYQRLVRIWFMNIIQIVVHLVAIHWVIARFDRHILGLLIVFLFTYFALSFVLTRRASAAARRVNEQEEILSGQIFESVHAIRTVKAMGIATRFITAMTATADEALNRIGVRVFRYQSRGAILAIWDGIARVGLIVLVINGIAHGYYAIAFLIMFNSYFSDLRTAIDELSSVSMDIMVARISIGRLRDIMAIPITIDSPIGKYPFPKSWSELSITDVSFSYDTHPILRNITLHIKRGEKIGIVGLSGAGKSTLFKLLLKEREGFSGSIRLDDRPITDIDKSDFVHHVSVVLQDTEVFNFSLRDNILITTQPTTSLPIDDILTASHLHGLVQKLPQGLDTPIGEKGIRLSGGERQRLGLARAIARRPDILLLDEATSHLDVESEQLIQLALHDVLSQVTAIVIAHRLTTIQEMDRIVVMENGAIVEVGSFAELMAREGRFYTLWNTQRLGIED